MNGLLREAFIAHIFGDFQKSCSTRSIAPNMANFLDFLLSRKLIAQKDIYHYGILHEFRAWTDQGKYRNKTETIRALAAAYGIHESTIWNVIKDHAGKFRDHPMR